MKLTFQPTDTHIDLQAGQTILEGARQADIEITASCGGKGICRSCRIHVLEGELTAPTPEERQRLGAQQIGQNFRLACHAGVLSDCTVRIAPPLSEKSLNILSQTEETRHELDPDISKQHIEVPTFSEERQRSELEEIYRQYAEPSRADSNGPQPVSIDLAALRQMPSFLQQEARDLTVVSRRGTILALEPGNTTADMYGIAFDLGTTTVVGYLLDLHNGKLLASASELNSQARYGGDLMSRITFAQNDRNGRQILHENIVNTINKIVHSLCEQSGVTAESIYESTIAGNTCMHHLCLNIDPLRLGFAPYMAAIRQRQVCTASELGIHIHPQARIVMLPLIAGFVGADTVAVILASNLHTIQELTLAVDIGTNGEIVLAAPGRLLTCSTAAGTAFEGAQIQHGMRAAEGAIDKVAIDAKNVHCHVIGDGPALGICGSGLVDAVAHMLDAGVIEDGGRLLTAEKAEQKGLPLFLQERLASKGAPKHFTLLPAEQCDPREAIVITQQDIRELQLAKAAIAAGIEMLLRAMDVQANALHEILLAGAFGNYLDPTSALRIGLIPALSAERIRSIGNAAGLGAQRALLSHQAKHEADQIAGQTEHIALSGNAEFHRIFAENMIFPTLNSSRSMPDSIEVQNC
ncbi:hypothetical protein CSB45_02495 [candidate division KSB3 bacterium]|uniref:2Fe-2S ferredoxin-type domain-containing protein n=1 Tax=candidate division KSB3 bacterium TaxID=2044937 RepID=A0A2G6EAV6_9BACT|nr:MAG: hypothetical protein CSB45_02495 [candidate division KSB3 bacterium]PIE30949.1 MAG: hypothetical protein CSA57_01110 [candidate division KSB3 bacterium]